MSGPGRWACISIFVSLLLTACTSTPYAVVEEDDGARMRFVDLEVLPEVRRGPNLGLLLRARVEDASAAPEPFHVRFSWRDLQGIQLPSNRFVETITDLPVPDSLGEPTAVYEPAIVLVPAPMIRFDAASGDYPVRVECFIPYHWFKLEQGAQRLWVDLEAVAGKMEGRPEQDFGGVLAASQERERWGHVRIQVDVDLPKLYAARVSVKSIILDSAAFDPHQMDLSVNAGNPTHGYPDLFWSLGLGYESVYASEYYPNSLRGKWKEETPVIYVRRRDEELSLCAMDWDNARILNNRHDLIACWEGRLIQISTDVLQPTRLSFDRVAEMEVTMEWLQE